MEKARFRYDMEDVRFDFRSAMFKSVPSLVGKVLSLFEKCQICYEDVQFDEKMVYNRHG